MKRSVLFISSVIVFGLLALFIPYLYLLNSSLLFSAVSLFCISLMALSFFIIYDYHKSISLLFYFIMIKVLFIPLYISAFYKDILDDPLMPLSSIGLLVCFAYSLKKD
jgi:hypothetical protein